MQLYDAVLMCLIFEQDAELKEQFEQLRSQLRQIKNEVETQEKDIPMPHLEPQVNQHYHYSSCIHLPISNCRHSMKLGL
jgi:carbonic anhydrase